MIYRIDYQHFLTHAIDYFPAKTLAYQFQYLLLSVAVKFNGRISNGIKVSTDLYPDSDMIADYKLNENYEIFEKAYHAFLDRKPEYGQPITATSVRIYRTIVETYLNHTDVVIVCDKEENFIVDAFCSFIKKKYKIEVIDLNKLFTKGHVDSIRIDFDKTHDIAVDIRRLANNERHKELESTYDGRLKLVRLMTKKEKIKKLKSLGIKVTDTSERELDRLLMDAYVIDEEDQ